MISFTYLYMKEINIKEKEEMYHVPAYIKYILIYVGIKGLYLFDSIRFTVGIRTFPRYTYANFLYIGIALNCWLFIFGSDI